jgi:hypothetical protein
MRVVSAAVANPSQLNEDGRFIDIAEALQPFADQVRTMGAELVGLLAELDPLV